MRCMLCVFATVAAADADDDVDDLTIGHGFLTYLGVSYRDGCATVVVVSQSQSWSWSSSSYLRSYSYSARGPAAVLC